MTIPRGVVFLIVLAVAGGETIRGFGLEDCLKTDSLECVQNKIVRNLRSFFGEGIGEFPEEVPSVAEGSGDRKVRAVDVPLSSKDPGQRKGLLDVKASSDSSDSSSNSSSETASENVHEESIGVIEGRGKKLKKLLPYLLVLKIQYFVYGVIAYVLITLIAKAALLKGSLALALAGVFLLKRLLTSPHVVARTQVKFHESSHTNTYVGGGGYGAGGGGGGYGGAGYGAGQGGSYGGSYDAGHSAGGWDSYNAPIDQNKQYAHTSGHSVAYRGQKPQGR